MKFVMFLEYRNTVPLRGVCAWNENNQVKSFSHIQNRNLQPDNVWHFSKSAPVQISPHRNPWPDNVRSSWTISGPTGQCPDFEYWPNGYILERALYIPIQLQWLFSLDFQILLLKEFIPSILRAFSRSPLELSFNVHCSGLSEARIQVLVWFSTWSLSWLSNLHPPRLLLLELGS
jgi:hypothetical protein